MHVDALRIEWQTNRFTASPIKTAPSELCVPPSASFARVSLVVGSKKGENMTMIQKIVPLIIMVLILTAVSAAAASSEKESGAVISAEKWLAMVDSEKYAESWKEAAELFRNAVNQEQWKQSMQGARKPLGKLVTRKVKTKSYKTALPGAPDGEYVVIQFETSFEHKKSAIETVTPMIDKDGKWRVSGYYIK
jgi:hypothetical protein